MWNTVEKPNSVIVYGYNKYLLEQSESTQQIDTTVYLFTDAQAV